MLPEYTTIKMKLFSVSQWKIDDVFPIFSTVRWTLFEVDLSWKKKQTKTKKRQLFSNRGVWISNLVKLSMLFKEVKTSHGPN